VPLEALDHLAQLGLVEMLDHKVLLVSRERRVHRALRETLAVREVLEQLDSLVLQVKKELVEIRDQLVPQDSKVQEGQMVQLVLREMQVHEEI